MIYQSNDNFYDFYPKNGEIVRVLTNYFGLQRHFAYFAFIINRLM